MFTGIIEDLGTILDKQQNQNNISFKINSRFVSDVKIDQSIAHNGVCLTVENITDNAYWVTAIAETLNKTNLKYLEVGDKVNLERSLKLNDRLDGHIVQGHVDETAICTNIQNHDGSWEFEFQYDKNSKNVTIEKGSISVNGVSLTVVKSQPHSFSVAIIPYTFLHTNFQYLQIGSVVNLEFDVLGKYIARLMSRQ